MWLAIEYEIKSNKKKLSNDLSLWLHGCSSSSEFHSILSHFSLDNKMS